jgi:hypothetical protein
MLVDAHGIFDRVDPFEDLRDRTTHYVPRRPPWFVVSHEKYVGTNTVHFKALAPMAEACSANFKGRNGSGERTRSCWALAGGYEVMCSD